MIEILVGLEVSNDANYTLYRKAMLPLLTEMGGGFGYDFKIAAVLKKETENKINRVFTIQFPSEKVKEQFFNNHQYLKIKKEFFEDSVVSTTIIANYSKE